METLKATDSNIDEQNEQFIKAMREKETDKIELSKDELSLVYTAVYAHWERLLEEKSKAFHPWQRPASYYHIAAAEYLPIIEKLAKGLKANG